MLKCAAFSHSRVYFLFLAQRAAAAFLAISIRCSSGISIRFAPDFFPPLEPSFAMYSEIAVGMRFAMRGA